MGKPRSDESGAINIACCLQAGATWPLPFPLLPAGPDAAAGCWSSEPPALLLAALKLGCCWPCGRGSRCSLRPSN